MAEKLGYGFVLLLVALAATVIVYPIVAEPDGRGAGVPSGLILLFLAWAAWRGVIAGKAKVVLKSAAVVIITFVISFWIKEFG